jgi:hypothetical protein
MPFWMFVISMGQSASLAFSGSMFLFSRGRRRTSVDLWDRGVCPSYSEKWHKCFVERRTSLRDDSSFERPPTNDLVQAISSMLKERFFIQESLPVLPHRKGGLLMNSAWPARYEKFSLRCVSHALGVNQKIERPALSHGILSLLSGVRSRAFQNVITDDESCFFLPYKHDLI